MRTIFKRPLLIWLPAALLMLTASIAAIVLHPPTVSAQAPGEFSLQVSPSPLVATVKPGQTTDLELKIRNAGTTAEDLKIEPRSFKLNDTDGSVVLNDTAPPDVNQWISFSEPSFTVQPGQWFTQKIHVALPKDAGFSYSFALIVSRQNTPKPTEGGRLIKGSLAVFTLLNVDRPGATRKLDVVELETDKQVYEYLPSQISVRFKNSGNTIVQPYGNIFIQRSSSSPSPLATLPVNETKGYILPGSSRTLKTNWEAGFPTFKTNDAGNTSESWDWSKIADFRIGQYTAKLVGVYNDGVRDVPIESEVTFWVIPWKIILGGIVVLALVVFALWSIIRKIIHLFRRKKTPKVSLKP
ncbi:MAG: hypothetical protein ABIQ04_04620 [Candidatus Saccharimonadales bacterium]